MLFPWNLEVAASVGMVFPAFGGSSRARIPCVYTVSSSSSSTFRPAGLAACGPSSSLLLAPSPFFASSSLPSLSSPNSSLTRICPSDSSPFSIDVSLLSSLGTVAHKLMEDTRNRQRFVLRRAQRRATHSSPSTMFSMCFRRRPRLRFRGFNGSSLGCEPSAAPVPAPAPAPLPAPPWGAAPVNTVAGGTQATHDAGYL